MIGTIGLAAVSPVQALRHAAVPQLCHQNRTDRLDLGLFDDGICDRKGAVSSFKQQERVMAYPTAYTSTVKIPLPSEQTVKQMMGESYDPKRTLNVLKMFAGTEDLYEATIGIVRAMFAAKGIDPRTREMIILRASKVLNAPYEAQANVQMAKNAGLSSAEIDAAAGDGPVSGINPEYVLVCKATDELSENKTLRDETLRDLLSKYGETNSRKIVLMIAWFNMLSLFLNGCRVPLETSDKVGTRTSPLG